MYIVLFVLVEMLIHNDIFRFTLEIRNYESSLMNII